MYLEDRSKRLLLLLMNEHDFVTTDYLSDKLNVSIRSIYKDIESINHWLISQRLSKIESVRMVGYRLPVQERDLVKEIMDNSDSISLLTQQERHHLLFCILIGKPALSIDDLQSYTMMSRNTLFTDLKLVRSRLERYNLKLMYKARNGYYVEGDEVKRRSLFIYHHLQLYDLLQTTEAYEDIFSFALDDIKTNLNKLSDVESELKTEYVEGTLYSLATIITLVDNQALNPLDLDIDDKSINLSDEYKALERTFPNLSSLEIEYLTIHLLGARTQISIKNDSIGQYIDIAIEMIQRFEVLSAIEFNQVSLLINQISNHLAISHIRYRFGLHQSNPLLHEIKQNYEEIFHFTHQVCDVIRERLKVPVSESEVAYIALHFNSFIRRKNYTTTSSNVIVVCPQGLSTSRVLKQEIESLSPMISVVDMLSLKQFESMKESSDVSLIVSTVFLETSLPYVKVNTMLSEADKNAIMKRLPISAGDTAIPTIDKIMDIVSPYVKDTDESQIKAKLMQFFSQNEKLEPQPFTFELLDKLSPDTIRLSQLKHTYQEAIELTCKPLLQTGVIEPMYSKEIIKSIDKFGPYMVLPGGYMIAHASYNHGVNEVGVSFLKLEKTITLEDKSFNKIFVLAPIDQYQHLGIMKDLLSIFNDIELVSKLDSATNANDIYYLLYESLNQ